MLTAASLLTAKFWKAQETVTIEDWIRKVNYICLVHKRTAISRFRAGNVDAVKKLGIEWDCFQLKI